jgi:GDPmannose 4,6-dehydratase
MKALVTGISGQDGAYMSKLLLDHDFQVVGVTRDINLFKPNRLKSLNIFDKLTIISANLEDFKQTTSLLEHVKPTHIFNFGSLSSVSMSFEKPQDAFVSISIITINLLESIRLVNPSIRFFNAGSSEIFGECPNSAATEISTCEPKSPYGVAKLNSKTIVNLYRNAYGIFAVTGILSNHESPLRSHGFVFPRILNGALCLKNGFLRKVTMGNGSVIRDWGWAPDYIYAAYLMITASEPIDYIIATGKSVSLFTIAKMVANKVDVNYQMFEFSAKSLDRPYDLKETRLNPTLIYNNLGWSHSKTLSEIIDLCLDAFSTSQNGFMQDFLGKKAESVN